MNHMNKIDFKTLIFICKTAKFEAIPKVLQHLGFKIDEYDIDNETSLLTSFLSHPDDESLIVTLNWCIDTQKIEPNIWLHDVYIKDNKTNDTYQLMYDGSEENDEKNDTSEYEKLKQLALKFPVTEFCRSVMESNYIVSDKEISRDGTIRFYLTHPNTPCKITIQKRFNIDLFDCECKDINIILDDAESKCRCIIKDQHIIAKTD